MTIERSNLLTTPDSGFRQQVETDGFAIIANVISVAAAEELALTVGNALKGMQNDASQEVHGARNLLDLVPAVRELVASSPLHDIATQVLGRDCFAVRGIWFDKVEGANWKVPWHQDVSIAVREWQEVDGFGPWSRKAGVPHAHAPVALLERMLTLRLHLDDCDENNGPLRVLPGTHRLGKLNASLIREQQTTREALSCVVGSGGVVIMRPLLLHASSPAQSPRHRRVIHLEYAAESLPNRLQWQSQVGKGENVD